MADLNYSPIPPVYPYFEQFTNEELEDDLMAFNESMRELRNKRGQLHTLEDALDAYEGLVKDAYKARADSRAGQTQRLKMVGRQGTHNHQWAYPPNYANACELIRDHEGEQAQLEDVKSATYEMDLTEYRQDLDSKEVMTARIRQELALRQANSTAEQAHRAYQETLTRIEGA